MEPNALKQLRLVHVVSVGADESLISLTTRTVLAEADELWVCEGVPKVYVGEKEEAAARVVSGGDTDDYGWPGWPIIMEWLDGLQLA